MSYLRPGRGRRPLAGPPSLIGQSATSFGFPGGLPFPGPVGPAAPSAPTPTMPASLFPTQVGWGDVVNVQGPFAGRFQGDAVVRFAGARPQAVAMMGPYGGSVVVPEGAQTGACTIELGGRTIFSAQCVVTPRRGAMPREHADIRSWKGYGPDSSLMGSEEAMAYVNDGTGWSRGVGAIAAADGPGSASSASSPLKSRATRMATKAFTPRARTTTARTTTARTTSKTRRAASKTTSAKRTSKPAIGSGIGTSTMSRFDPREAIRAKLQQVQSASVKPVLEQIKPMPMKPLPIAPDKPERRVERVSAKPGRGATKPNFPEPSKPPPDETKPNFPEPAKPPPSQPQVEPTPISRGNGGMYAGGSPGWTDPGGGAWGGDVPLDVLDPPPGLPGGMPSDESVEYSNQPQEGAKSKTGLLIGVGLAAALGVYLLTR